MEKTSAQTQKWFAEVAAQRLLKFAQFLHNAGMQIGTRRTMDLQRRMLLQHPHNNCNDADRRQTAYLTYNARNYCTNAKIAFPLQLKFQHRALHVSRSMALNRSAWFCQSFSIASKLRSKKATAKTAQNKNSCHWISMARTIDTAQKLALRSHRTILHNNARLSISPV